MKFLKFLIPFLSLICCGQNSHNFNAFFVEKTYQQKEVTQDGVQIVNDKSTSISKYLFLLNHEVSSIIFYDSKELMPISFSLVQNNAHNLILQIRGGDLDEDFNITFNDQERKIVVKDDFFILNFTYYKFLKENVKNKRRIVDLLDFIDDFLPDYSPALEPLKFISSKAKYKNGNFEIDKGVFTTKNEQIENKFVDWELSYSGKFQSFKMSNKEDTRFEKTFIRKNKSLLYYKMKKNSEERNFTDEIIKFDVLNSVYKEEGTYLQTGQNKEIQFTSYLSRGKKITLKNTNLSREEVGKLFIKYLP